MVPWRLRGLVGRLSGEGITCCVCFQMSLPKKDENVHMNSSLFYYSYTLTKPDGFSEEELAELLKFISKFEFDVCVTEEHESGDVHIHGMTGQVSKSGSNLNKKFCRWYNKMSIPISFNSINVKKISSMSGWCAYLVKDQKDKSSSTAFHMSGWKSTWIDTQAKKNVMSRVPGEFKKSKHLRLNRGTAVSVIIAWIKAHDLQEVEGASGLWFVDCMKAMMSDGYEVTSLPSGKMIMAQVVHHFNPGSTEVDEKLCEWCGVFR